MNAAAILGLGKDLGQRFTLVDLLPSALLGLFILALVWGGAPGDAPDLDRFVARVDDLSGVESVLLALALLGFALVTQPLQLGLVRLMEGYWGTGRAAASLAARARTRHLRLREELVRLQLTTAADSDRDRSSRAQRNYAIWSLARLYPPEPLVMPTRLGNALRAAEDRAGGRYGLETIIAWPRLYPLLSDRVAALVDDQRTQMDIAARFTAVLLGATAVSAVLLAPHGWWLFVPAATLALAWLSYRGACSAAVTYGEGLETAFDLHRLDLRSSLHLPVPRTLEEERALNEELSTFLLEPFAGHQLTYADDDDAAAAESPPAGSLGSREDRGTRSP